MRERLAIANQLRISRKNFTKNLEDKKMCSKCYYTYIVECIIKGKKDFQIRFKGKYIQSLSERISDWYNYILDSTYRFFLIHFNLKNDKYFREYKLIHFGVSKPIHLKIARTPNEVCLYSFLEKNGFEITGEHLKCEATIYDVTRA